MALLAQRPGRKAADVSRRICGTEDVPDTFLYKGIDVDIESMYRSGRTIDQEELLIREN